MLEFSTKAGTLKALEGHVTKSRVLPQAAFTAQEIADGPDEVRARVRGLFADGMLIVRSSADGEDSEGGSQAGRYLSLLDVAPANVVEAALEVLGSYGGGGSPRDQVLVQPMLRGIAMSGVLFTVDPNTGGNYFVINYDDSTGSTQSITSGAMSDPSTCYVFRGKKTGDARIDGLIEAAEEIMALFGKDAIDMEFAYTVDGALYMLQARPLVMKLKIADIARQREALGRAHGAIVRGMGAHPYVQGDRTVYGVMPDWNPAEMIGIRPKPLAASLYRKLITDGTWAYQRNEYGYKNLRSFPLMVEFCGLPYIDVRISFNSFIPQDIDGPLSGKLVNYYLDCLAEDPDKHDKVEFEIVFSCNTFDLPARLGVLAGHGFTESDRHEIRDSLRRLTNNIISVRDGLWIVDAKKIDILDKRRETIVSSGMDDISKIYWLIADCTRYGTLPFAGLARAGFIAVQLLKSLVSIGILSEKEYNNYMGGLNTVSARMSSDRQELSRAAFLRKYGHLRPGTYDITSKRYDMAPELYFGGNGGQVGGHGFSGTEEAGRPVEPFVLSLEQYAAIRDEMRGQMLEGDALALFEFIRAGIEGREHAKFVFTKSLSHVLELLAGLGGAHGFSREDMAYMDYFLIDKLYSSTVDIKGAIGDSIADGKARHADTLTLTMPPVILKPDDIYAFHMPSCVPNYITLGEAAGDVCADDLSSGSVAGKIVMIRSADPGYDWIFSCGIKGFVTAYGGANSHMAIRAGELGIPAAIGVGEKVFTRLSSASRLRLDCANRLMEVLR